MSSGETNIVNDYGDKLIKKAKFDYGDKLIKKTKLIPYKIQKCPKYEILKCKSS